jgi:hypothetical protein
LANDGKAYLTDMLDLHSTQLFASWNRVSEY